MGTYKTHTAIIRSSGRKVPVQVNGPIFWVLHPTSSPYPSVSGPFRRKDRRFQLLPRNNEKTSVQDSLPI